MNSGVYFCSQKVFMEVVLRLGFCVLVLVAARCAPATTALPSSECQSQCGDVQISYPFGIGPNCSLAAEFDVTCEQDQDGITRPSIGGRELLNISLTDSTIRMLNNITYYCYNETWHMNSSEAVTQNSNGTQLTTVETYNISIGNSPFRLSVARNNFTVIGCNTLGLFGSSSEPDIESGCFSSCGQNLSVQTDGSCSGIGCCQTAIPKGVDLDALFLGILGNISQTPKRSGLQCSYAMLMEAEAFSFSPTYINTTRFVDMDAGRAPAVLDWYIRNQTCEVAKRNLTRAYACHSSNSVCVDSTSSIGTPVYVCNCSEGYGGNPYLPDGCTVTISSVFIELTALVLLHVDVDECIQRQPCPSDGVCHNTNGGYRCSCGAGRKYSPTDNACIANIQLIIGVTVGFFLLMILCFGWYMIVQKRKQNKAKQEYFHQYGGMILLETMKSEKGLSFTVFSEAELRDATNNYDKSRIIGKGGHGTVYKGVVKGNMPVAIKRCTLIDERQKKEFGQEMLILSQVNHKNIVKLVGCCLEVEVPMLVYEFVPNGTMYQLIHGRDRSFTVSFSTLLRIAHEAAEGLNFLHSFASPPILHGDVKTANILLDENYMAKVSDFGASILAPSDTEQFVTMVQGTVGYLDPEYMQTSQLTEKSDVYSFGVILLEVLTGEVPLKLYGPEAKRSLTSNFLSAMKANNLGAVVASHIKEQESTELIGGIAELAKNCLDMCGSNRPSMKEIADELSRLRKLTLHPWVQLNMEEKEAQRLLCAQANTSFETETSTIIEYPAPERANQSMIPSSSYYAR
ncbi:hypothetical protein U9M48_014002 [Paspalum notatum var. saurae]|uniref:Protein kinase domain-containing protein n=1 Tax=Paspalum notatum var. saurae TaxID=547442 RepID=A0AAQ3WK42_PASNO